jgi:hypothetical protein
MNDLCEGGCQCEKITTGVFINNQIDVENVTCTNEREVGGIKKIFKDYESRNSPYKVDTRGEPYIMLVHIPFICNTRISSLLIKSTFKEVRVYSNSRISLGNWKTQRNFEVFHPTNGLHFHQLYLKGSKFRNSSFIYLLLISDQPSSLFYLGLKGGIVAGYKGPIVATYEAISTKPGMVENKNVLLN